MTDVAVAAAVAVTEPGAGHGSAVGSPEVQLNASIGLDGAGPAENQPAAAAEAADSTENEDCDAMGDGSSGAVLSKPIDVLDGLLVNEVEKPKFTSVPTGEVDYRSSADVKSKYRPWGKTPQVPTSIERDSRPPPVIWCKRRSTAVRKDVQPSIGQRARPFDSKRPAKASIAQSLQQRWLQGFSKAVFMSVMTGELHTTHIFPGSFCGWSVISCLTLDDAIPPSTPSPPYARW